MIEYVLAAAATGTLLHLAFRGDRKKQPEQAQSTATGSFDYLAMKEQNDNQREALRHYEQANQLVDDVSVAMQTGETLSVFLSWNDHTGEQHSLSMPVHPDTLRLFANRLLSDCTKACSTPLSVKLLQNSEKRDKSGYKSGYKSEEGSSDDEELQILWD